MILQSPIFSGSVQISGSMVLNDGTISTTVEFNDILNKPALISGSNGSTDWQSTIQTNNFTVEAGKGYFVNTTSAEITVTLPAGVVGNQVIIQDYAGTFATNKVIFASNGSEKIQGLASNGECKIKNATVTLIYQDATQGWTSQDVVEEITNLVASGGTETTSGGYKYHKFTSSGTLNVNTAGSYEYLIVAGAGGGGFDGGGGGGAGGLLQSSGIITETGNYTITVGAGGTGASGYNITPDSGNDSSISKSGFTTIAATGGGGASRVASSPTYAPTIASNGGSGGGGMGTNSNQASDGGTGITGQGNDGGDGVSGHTWKGAGGGGAGTVGGDTTSGIGGNGGAGLQYSTWATATGTGANSGYYAGGGGGAGENGTKGLGGDGGGGNGGAGSTHAIAGTANTGGGGGGGDQSNDDGKAGGSGIVIIRYNI